MRDYHKDALKKTKQQINALCLCHGYHYDDTKWTTNHVTWLRKLELSPLYRETLNEYMASFDGQTVKIGRYDKRIASGERLSSEKISRTGISKAGNSHLRLLLIETARGICEGAVSLNPKNCVPGNGNPAEAIAYADKANTRLRSHYYKFIRHGKQKM